MISALGKRDSRSKILASLVIIIMAVFVMRLFYLQIIKHDYYLSVADSEQVKRLTVPAKRGLIYALDGTTPVKIVMNQTVYTVFADPQMTDDDGKIIDVVRKVAGGSAKSNLQELLDKKESRYQILATKLTRTQADKIKQENLQGVGFQEVTQRVYPEGALAAQILGFVDFEGKGQYGVEGGMNDRLLGKDGILQSVTDVSDVPLTIGNRNVKIPAEDGDNIILTIDRNVQSYTEQALKKGMKNLGAKNGSVMVMDPNNGRVMAMASLPSYKPAEFSKVQDASVFNNPVISYPYEPASIIKTFAMGLGVDRGAIKPTDKYHNTGKIKIDDRVIANAYKGQIGDITFQTALTWSLNTGAVTVFERLDNDDSITKEARDVIYDYYHNKFKLGQLTGIELDNEVAGQVVSPEESEGNAVRYANMSFGQGLDITMVQVAAGFSSLINGGQYYKPTVMAGIVDSDGNYVPAADPTPAHRTVSEATSATMKKMVHDARAAFYTYMDKPGYDIGGKTGTAETIINGRYSSDATVASYLGYGGINKPKYVIMVRLWGESQAFDGTMAIPIFTDISNWMIEYLRLQPKG